MTNGNSWSEHRAPGDLHGAAGRSSPASLPARAHAGIEPRGWTHPDAGQAFRFENLVGRSAAMRRVFELIEKLAPSDATVLLTGESGVGKELVARALHSRHPRRAQGPFVAVHGAAIPEALFEATLFGHVRGAFTGADRGRPGRIELAHGGTLLLDEVATMKPDLQVKLLRALQERCITRLGGTRPVPVDVRVIAATNANLAELVTEGGFRADVYYRLSALPIHVPPLRDRSEDLPLLVGHFLRRALARAGAAPLEVTPEAMRRIREHAWPGNVRELENALEFAVLVAASKGRIDAEDLPLEPASGAVVTPRALLQPSGQSFRAALEDLERRLILEGLRAAGGNKARAAALLGLSRSTFVDRLRKVSRRAR